MYTMGSAMQATPMLGKYRLLAELGQGGMAKVYLALAQGPAGFNKLVVLKEIHGELAEDPDLITMFLDEARLAARLNHPNIVQTNEIGQDNGHYFIAMEYLEGQTYNRIFNRLKGKLSLGMQLRAVAEALHGLHYAHELRDFDGSPLHVVHRDVSPHNIFVTYNGQVKVVDFGIAKALNSSTETRPGILKGKAAYMAPEQARGSKVDRRADLFAVGVMLWEIAAGHRMHRGEQQLTILQKLITGEIPRAAQASPDVHPRLAAIIDRALAERPDDRFSSAADLARELESMADELGDKAGVRELGALISAHFANDRQKVAAIVEEQLKLAPEQIQALPMIENAATVETGPASLRGPGSGSGAGTGSGSLSFATGNKVITGVAPGPMSTGVSVQSVAVPPPIPASRKTYMLLGGAGAVGVLLALLVVKPWSTSSAGSAAPSTSAEATHEVTLRLETTPAGATIRDGEKVLGQAPLAITTAAGASPRELVAWLDGYEPKSVKVPAMSSDLTLQVALERKESTSPSAVAATSSSPEDEPDKPDKRGPGKSGPKKVPGTAKTPPPPPPPPTTGDIRLER